MTKSEYKLSKEIIIDQFGKPEYEMSLPVNESAKKLAELKQAYIKAKQDIKKNKVMVEKISKLPSAGPSVVSYPEDLLRPEWLVSFTDVQRKVIYQWIKDIDQSAKQIADAINTTVPAVNATKSLEAFKMLRAYLTNAFKDQLPFPALFKLKQLLGSSNESVAKDVAKMILIDAGIFKQDSIEQVIKTDKTVLDKDLQEKYKALGDQILGINDDSQTGRLNSLELKPDITQQ